ncbi:ATP-binding protein [Guptibacillus hwajinpoensis]|uniref:histidine kinase n=1 Tax=Guptibacillus hwajinpoensis TaxID=208199 RepID=A0ABU0K5M3_9BACL|nr:ATP-binding protein [Alkalihalobacillus hemicentroti]MDQ0484650.1 two-component system sporulation sensor kinase B [Alkalihalobacillus hemicentroti]
MLEMARPLLINIAMLFSVLFIWNMVMPFRRSNIMNLKRKLIYGLISSIMALLCMLFPLEKFGDTVFDLRVVPLILVTLYGGGFAGLICMLTISSVRLGMGGEYAWVGVLIAVVGYMIALSLNGYFKRSIRKWKGILLTGGVFMLSYIAIVWMFIDPLKAYFYPIYFTSFAIAYFFIFYLTERLVLINIQLEETVYLEKLSVAGKMAAAIAHEIRNPLTTVRGLLQFISNDTQDEKIRNYAPLMIEEIDRTNKIITDYLMLIKPSKIEYEVVKLNQVVKDTTNLTEVLASYHAVELQYEEKGEFTIHGNSQELKQCLINLIKNAIESIEEEGFILITLQDGTKKGTVDIVIQDNGAGMTEEQLEKIGLPFYTTKSKGTGLGTMITIRLIRNMGGKVLFQSKVEEGTTVTVTLPTFKGEYDGI